VLLDNKVVIVTGASRGIGRAIAVACAKEGAHVVLNYWGDNDRSYGRLSAVEEVVDEIETLGRRVIAVEGNVAQRETGLELVKQAVDAFGHVDVLASNAGICPFHTFLDMPASVYEATVGVNLNGAFYVTQAVANQMKLQGTGGAIVATSSISALVGGAMQTHYTPTKAGVHSLMQSCAIALGPYGIRCNSVMPGTIATDLNAEDLADTGKRAYFEKRIPLGRLGEPDDVAQCVTFLASDRARYVTGASLLVDGGLFVNLQ
jgi:L-rhamnose 1-dehydrogenase